MSNLQELQEMAKLTLLTNRITDIQAKNLQMFPLIFFDGVSDGRVEYDLSNQMGVDSEENAKDLEIKYSFGGDTDHLKVSYHLTLDPDVENLNIEKRLSALESSVRGILWKEIKVEVYLNEVKRFESAK